MKKELMFPLNIQLFAEEEEAEEEEVEEEDADDDEEEDDKESGKKKKKEKTFTQQEVNRLTSKEKRQGRIAAYRALGIDPRNKEQVARAKELLKGLNTSGGEEDKSDKAENNKLVDEADRKLLEADCKIKAIELNALPRCVDDIVVLALAKMADGDDMGDVIAEIKETHPSMFGKVSSNANDDEEEDNETDDEEETKRNKGGKNKKYTGKSLGEFKKKVSKETDSKSLGQSLAKMRKKKAVKKSMFD